MRFTLIISLGMAILAVVFALMNSQEVAVNLGFATFQGPLALVLLVTLAMGVLIGYLGTLSLWVKSGWKIWSLKRVIKKKDKEVAEAFAAPPPVQTAKDVTPEATDVEVIEEPKPSPSLLGPSPMPAPPPSDTL